MIDLLMAEIFDFLSFVYKKNKKKKEKRVIEV